MASRASLARVIFLVLLAITLSFSLPQAALARRVLARGAAITPVESAQIGPEAASVAQSGPEAASVAQSGAEDPCTAWSEEIATHAAANWDIAKPSTVRECLRNFKLRESDVEDLRSVVNGINNHYVYKDIAVDSPDQTNLPSSVDIVAELTAILQRAEQGEYERLMDVHVDTLNAINGLNDGHTYLSSNCFFSTASFFLPLPLFAVVEDGQQIIRVATRQYFSWFTGIDEDAKMLWDFDFSAYELQQVVAIDGQPAVEYIKSWAEKYGGMVRNPSARFNTMFAGHVPMGRGGNMSPHPGEFVLRELVPEADTLQVSIFNGGAATNVSVPWMAISYSKPFADSDAYWSLNCAKHQEPCAADAAAAGNAPNANSSSGGSSTSNGAKDLRGEPPVFRHDVLRHRPQYQQHQQPHPQQQQQPNKQKEQESSSHNSGTGSDSSSDSSSNEVSARMPLGSEESGVTVEVVSADNAYFQVFLINKRTAVIVLHTFDVDDTTEAELAATRPDVDVLAYLAGEIISAMEAARSADCEEVIFDVRVNGGGYVAMASVTLVALLGTKNVPLADATLPMDFIIGTNLTWNLLTEEALSSYTAEHYTRPEDGASPLQSTQDYTPLQNISFTGAAGSSGIYTADFKLYFENFYNGLTDQPGSSEPFFGSRPFLFLADGDCFSTCAILTHMLGKRYQVPMVTVGGLLNQPVSVSASCLGYTMLSLNCDVSVPLSRTSHATDPQASKPFKTNMDVGMAFTNGYVDSKVPCEFEFLPSQRHIDYTVDLIDKPEAIWSEAAKLFPELPLAPVIAQSASSA
ncbi:hypothetical protein CLOM_g17230 [Closterium sp. NIES-68]|nr:hypothetical protein CLOM_g17230 [Closterium sp. NIES-68]GJP67246.1 hypothetical protein CLOP_g24089 [Closterium sp. NIES-67]